MRDYESLKNYWGIPITVESDVKVTEAAPLPADVHPDMQAAYEQAQAKVLAITAVTRTNIASCFSRVFPQLLAQVRDRLGPGTMFYITNAAGTTLHMGRTDITDMLQSVMDHDLYDSLTNNERGTNNHAEYHLQAIGDMLIPVDGLVFEMGAGTDWTRIRKIDSLARARNSQVVCHDLLPATSHLAAKEVPGIPYLALPSDPDLVGECLAVFKGKATTIALKNTASSISFNTMTHIWHIAADAAADQVVISQSLPLSENSNVFLTNLEPYSDRLSAQLLPLVLRDPRVPQSLAYVAIVSAHRTLRNVMFEVVRHYLAMLAEKADMPHSETYFTEHSTIVTPGDVESVLEDLRATEAKRLWQARCFNHIEYSPTGLHKSFDKDVAPDHLKVTSRQFHLRFGRKPNIAAVQGKQLAPEDLLCPKNRIAHDYIDGLDLAFSPAPKAVDIKRLLSNSSALSNIERAQRAGIEIALDFIFGPYAVAHPIIQNMPPKEKERIKKWYRREAGKR